MEVVHNSRRVGNFTSSEIFALCSNGKKTGEYGKPFYTYVEEKVFERRMLRSLDTEVNARALTWGKWIETRVFDLLGLEYTLCSQDTIVHPTIDAWSGSPDGIKHDEGQTVIDIKSPLTLKSFCQLSECKTPEELRENHKDGDKYYWQLVSNAILTNSKWAELIVYCPFLDELKDIKQECEDCEDSLIKKHLYWIVNAEDAELPYLLREGQYNNIHIIRWEVPQVDKELLKVRVEAATKILNEVLAK